MKLRYLVLATLVAATFAACGQSPTAPTASRTTNSSMTTSADSAERGGGLSGSGH
ncbi:MAG TPA: hypothetical protein VFS20_06025 [Longimicrobium sp.]|nr:hypothetical protein [Longimicrobium sp.]